MKKVWLIGAGTMALEYTKVLTALNADFIVIGRGQTKAEKLKQATGADVVTGGIESFLLSKPEIPQFAIVAVPVVEMKNIALLLMQYGIKNILLEKPGCTGSEEIDILYQHANQNHSQVYIAYNRRFYASTLAAQKIMKEDGGVTSFNFEFTEWSHVIEQLSYPKGTLEIWFLGNSSHVVDLAFYLGGFPKKMACFTSGEISWHKPAIYAGSGITENNALFSYQANWAAPGRWAVEILTHQHRLYFKPMETLQIQNIGSVKVEPFEIDDHLDTQFKPGLYLETEAFLNNDTSVLCTLREQRNHIHDIYSKIDTIND